MRQRTRVWPFPSFNHCCHWVMFVVINSKISQVDENPRFYLYFTKNEGIFKACISFFIFTDFPRLQGAVRAMYQSEGKCFRMQYFNLHRSKLSATTKICGGKSKVTMRLSERTTIFCEGYFHITLFFKGIYKWSDCQGWTFLLQWWASTCWLTNVFRKLWEQAGS